MSVLADTDGRAIILTAPPIYKTRVDEVPGGRHVSKRKAWLFPLTWAHCVMLRGTFGDELEVSPALRDWAIREKTRRVDPALEARS